MKKFLSAIAAFFRSLFRKADAPDKPQAPHSQNVDEVAHNFYRDLLDSEAKRRR
ncbi:MAG TPA: hypothetical protein VI958_13325 [Acidobacteriota bacterium]